MHEALVQELQLVSLLRRHVDGRGLQPLMQFQVVFRTLFGWVINREHEVFSSGVIAAIVVMLR